jgi:hypothetical protein
MILVLCEETDVSALWAADALRLRGLSPAVLTGADLASVERWQHRIGRAGADCEIRLSGGACLRCRETGGVLNRLPSVPSTWLRRFGGPDYNYAMQEMYAFYLSWLHALPGPKLNPPTPQGLCGNWRHPSAWVALAARVGLPVWPFRQTSDDDPASLWQMPALPSTETVHVAGTRVVGSSPQLRSYGAACLRLAEAAGATLLGIDFAPDINGEWKMTRATVMPDLVCGGEELADALAAALAP